MGYDCTMASANIYVLAASDGRLLASFEAMIDGEAQRRAAAVANSLGLAAGWHVVKQVTRPAGVPWFEEAYFATMALAKRELN